MSYEQTNATNVGHLVAGAQKKPGSHNLIEYLAVARRALLGRDHASGDVNAFSPNDCYRGTIHLAIELGKRPMIGSKSADKLVFTIVGHLHRNGQVKPQLADRAELQAAIRKALPKKLTGEVTIFNWAEDV
jgi:hypothetical protein